MTILMKRPKLTPPNGQSRVLLHSCCAPCSCDIIETLLFSGVSVTVFFYNPNIHPRAEYDRRKEEIIRFAQKRGVPFEDADYDPDRWFNRVKGLEREPERGRRCSACFDVRFERAAAYAVEHGFKIFTSSLGMSRWKDFSQICRSGMRAAAGRPGLVFWTHNWRKNGGQERRRAIIDQERFYRQQYCGCVFSARVRAGRKGLSFIELASRV